MKSRFSTILTALLLLSSQCAQSQFTILGKVLDDFSSDALSSVEVTAETEDGQIFTSYTIHDGTFELEIIGTTNYTLQFSKEGYLDSREDRLYFATSTNIEIEITVRLRRTTKSSKAHESILNTYQVPLSAVSSPDLRSRISSAYDVTTTSAASRPRYTQTPLPDNGQVTVGEWNDLHNWQDWIILLSDPDYSIMTELHQLYPTQRYAVLITNQNHAVLPNKKVSLLSDGIEIWTTVTDNAGRAELWSSITTDTIHKDLMIKVDNNDYDAIPISHGTNTIIIDTRCSTSIMMDIVFVVDATSSMSDEIDYLKAEILDVIQQIRSQNDDISYHMGSVFYRDHADEYLTRVSPLTDDESLLSVFLKNQNAAGGGDIPEALDAALEDVLNMEWREQSLKIAFLLLDAPPHDDQKTMDKIRNQVTASAAQGIKLIPITASGIDRQTEFLMKFMAVLTNGTYIFITDDSGIGKSHLTPIVSDYEVEYLNECLIRLISEYSRQYSCAMTSANEEAINIHVYPNPSVDYITVVSGVVPDKIEVRASNGMVLMTIEPTEKETRINLQTLINGVYHIMVVIDTTSISEQIILLQ